MQQIINIWLSKRLYKGEQRTSFFKLGTDTIQEVLTIALMAIFIFAVIYSNIGLTYKIGIGALVFTLLFVSTLANQALRQQREQDKKRLR